MTIQVKYTNPGDRKIAKRSFHTNQVEGRESMLLIYASPETKGRRGAEEASLLLDQIKREKGVWWMPWQQEAMKDVILCDKSWRGENNL